MGWKKYAGVFHAKIKRAGTDYPYALWVPENTAEEVEYMLQEIPKVVAYLRSMSPVWKDLEQGKKQFML